MKIQGLLLVVSFTIIAQNNYPIFLINTQDTSKTIIQSRYRDLITKIEGRRFLLAGCRATFEVVKQGDSVVIKRLGRPVYRTELLASAKLTASVLGHRKIKWCGYTFNFNPRDGSCLITSRDVSALLSNKHDSCTYEPIGIRLSESKIPVRTKGVELRPFVFNKGRLCGIGVPCVDSPIRHVVSKILASANPIFINAGSNYAVSVYNDSLVVYNKSGNLRKVNLNEEFNTEWLYIKPLWAGFLEHRDQVLISGVSMLPDSTFQLWALWLEKGKVSRRQSVKITSPPPAVLSVYDGSETGVVLATDTTLTLVYVEPLENKIIGVSSSSVRKITYDGLPFGKRNKFLPINEVFNRYINPSLRNVLAFYKKDTLVIIGQVPDYDSYPVGGENVSFIRFYLVGNNVVKQDAIDGYLCLYRLPTSKAIQVPENWLAFQTKFIRNETIQIVSGTSISTNDNKSFFKFVLKNIKTLNKTHKLKGVYVLKLEFK
ncbi:MAG: hypothetical protein GXO48_09775 [Chlorobi bacterium]|nr:hypothetical protein [Chlorobiota bacterium]